jgi:hypothetical protein
LADTAKKFYSADHIYNNLIFSTFFALQDKKIVLK